MPTASMRPLIDAPPSSPEFIIKKPHDDTRHRSKQWRPLEVDITPRTIKMETAAQGTSKRVTRTYSKRQSSDSNSNPSQHPVKRQRTESTDGLPPLPAAAGDATKAVKKPPSTIDGYFFSSTSVSSATRAPDPSSDGVFSGQREAGSPPSSPPARRWTSPRKLKFRPSLLPISGNKDDDEAQSQEGMGGLEVDDRGGGHDSAAESLKRKRRQQLSGNVKRRRRSRTKDEGGEEDTESPRSKDGGAQRDPTTVPRGPVYDGQETEATESTGTSHDDDAEGQDSSVPNYTMPYSFYLKTANSESRSSPPATATARKPRRTIQTTLNLSSKQPFKECKLCDTVYNPLHALDVKLHQLRHARLLGEKEEEGTKKRRGARRSV